MTTSNAFRLTAALAASAIALVGAVPAETGGEPGPKAVIETTVAQVLDVLRQKKLPQKERRAKLEDIVYARFDFHTMWRLVLGKYRKQFTKEQQDDFAREFKEYLANNYGSRLDRYNQEEVEIVGDRETSRGDVIILTRIVGGEFNGATVDYRLRSKDGPWLVIDVTIEGVSLVSNYKDQFKEVLANGGPELLIQKLREKNAAGATDEIS